MLKHILAVAFACMTTVPCLSGAAQASAASSQLDCGRGPLNKTYGAAPWLVYACSDEKSVVVVSAPGNAGNPFYFMMFVKDGKRQVVGEGTGSKKITSAAYQELIKLTEADITALIDAAKAVPPAAAK